MRIVSAHCDNCGAPLEIPVRAKRVTCLYCDSALEVVHTGSVVATAVIEELQTRVSTVENQVQELKLRQRLDKLDEGWKNYRQRYFRADGRGGVPTEGQAIMFLVGAGIALVPGFLALKVGSPVAVLPFIICVVFVAASFGVRAEARKFNGQRQRYQRRRREVAKELRLIRDSTAGPAAEPSS